MISDSATQSTGANREQLRDMIAPGDWHGTRNKSNMTIRRRCARLVEQGEPYAGRNVRRKWRTCAMCNCGAAREPTQRSRAPSLARPCVTQRRVARVNPDYKFGSKTACSAPVR